MPYFDTFIFFAFLCKARVGQIYAVVLQTLLLVNRRCHGDGSNDGPH